MAADAEYTVRTCHSCGGRLLSAEYAATVNMRIDGKLHPVSVRRVPCEKCENCDTALFSETSDPYFQHAYTKYVNANNMNTWRHRAWRYAKRQWRLWETVFYRGPMWQWRRERRFPRWR